MIQLISQRFVSGLLSLIFIVVLITGIIYMAPVDPATLSFGQQMSEKALELKQKELGLDKPIASQIILYLNDLSPISAYSNDSQKLKDLNHTSLLSLGNNSVVVKRPYFRESFQTGDSIWMMIKTAMPNTILLALFAMMIATVIGLLFGMIAALKKDTWIDGFIVAVSTLGYSVPSYVSAIILSLIFGFYLKDWTHLNMQGSLITLNDIGDEVTQWKNLILPSIALGVRPVAVITQISRNAMLDVLSKPYVLTARAKGMSLISMIKKHVFKNMMNPVVTTISGWFASLLAGAFFVESIFNYNGMGLLTVNALLNYDTPLLLGCIVVIAAIFILLNLLVDFIYVYLDPKIRLQTS